jgi:benzoylformate decarboxylase
MHPQSGASYPGGSADLTVQFGTRDPGGGSVPSGSPANDGARYVAVGIDTNMLGRTQALDLSIVANVGETARDLMDAVKSMVTQERLERIRDARLSAILPSVVRRKENLLASARPNFDLTPIHPDRVDWELEQNADPNAIIVEENYTGRLNFGNFGYKDDQKLRLTKAGSLGWGLGAAIGAKIGAPDRQVILSIGDGALMYSAAGFWTMARYDVPILALVQNNHNYQMVRTGFHRLGGRMAETGHYHGMYLGDPEIDFVGLAASQGVAGARVTEASELGAALRAGLNETRNGRPYLLEVVIQRVGGGAASEWYQQMSVADMQAAALG